ncbi:MAG TPA: MarR family transcriptional regulator [Paucimonas sp.]|nr:MarR family transcriptional regulator [Paucimonas sp.]
MPSHQDEDVLDLLNALIFALKANLQSSLRDDGAELTAMEARALNFVARNPDSSQADLVQHSGRDKAQITRVIKQLEERGLLRRTARPDDRRSLRLSLTDEGRTAQKRVQQHRKRLAKSLMAGFDAGEREQAIRLLERLRSNVGA